VANYTEINTEKIFADHIRKFWVLDNSAGPFISPGKYALPNGCVTIAFISGNGVTVDFEKHTTAVKPGIYIVGQISTKIAVSLAPHTKAIMAQLNPWMPSLITNFPFYQLTDNMVSLAEINKSLHAALLNVDLSDEKSLIETLYKELENYLYRSADSELMRMVFNDFTAEGPLKIADIMRRTGYSARLMEQKFKQFIGPTPKEMQRILQLRILIDELVPVKKPALGTLAHKHGYFDQSHFIKSYHKIMLDQPKRFDAAHFILPLK
jgi:AraC-like DNA-binding protein